MKKITGLLLVLGCVLAFPAFKLHAQNSFEGTITMTMTAPIAGDDDQHSVIINIKGQKIETETDMGAMGIRKTYSDGKKSYSVMGGMKTGYVADISPDSGAVKAVMNQLDTVSFKPTGQKETIAGHPAEEYLIPGVNMMGMIFDISVWAAPGFPKSIQDALYHSLKNSSGMDPKENKLMMTLAGKGLLPVRQVMKKDGEVAVTSEFVKYEEKSLDDALFVPPADIKFSPMPKMPGSGTN